MSVFPFVDFHVTLTVNSPVIWKVIWTPLTWWAPWDSFSQWAQRNQSQIGSKWWTWSGCQGPQCLFQTVGAALTALLPLWSLWCAACNRGFLWFPSFCGASALWGPDKIEYLCINILITSFYMAALMSAWFTGRQALGHRYLRLHLCIYYSALT